MHDRKLIKHTSDCRMTQTIWPNFLMVDFYDQGDAVQVTMQFNSLPIPKEKIDDYYPNFKAYGAASPTAPRLSLLLSSVAMVFTTIALSYLDPRIL